MLPEKTNHFYWPTSSRGDVVIPEKAYQRVHEILLRLDFAGIETARASTAKWANEVAIIAGRAPNEGWGTSIAGMGVIAGESTKAHMGEGVHTLDGGLVRKKAGDRTASTEARAANVNDLEGVLVRKKGKHDLAPASEDSEAVNALGAGLVRKKMKT